MVLLIENLGNIANMTGCHYIHNVTWNNTVI